MPFRGTSRLPNLAWFRSRIFCEIQDICQKPDGFGHPLQCTKVSEIVLGHPSSFVLRFWTGTASNTVLTQDKILRDFHVVCLNALNNINISRIHAVLPEGRACRADSGPVQGYHRTQFTCTHACVHGRPAEASVGVAVLNRVLHAGRPIPCNNTPFFSAATRFPREWFLKQ